MDVVFGIYADRAAYPPHGGTGEGSSGEPVVGPLGLLDLLETHLGLSGPPHPQVVRIAAFQRKLEAADSNGRFYSGSLAADPWATARQLLGWRDALIEAGWRAGILGSARLADLSDVEGAGPALTPGSADRLAEVVVQLDSRVSRAIGRLRLIDERASLSPGWRRLLDRLEACDVVVEQLAVSAAADPGVALGRAQAWIEAGIYGRTGPDGSVVELVADTPIMAAEALATYFAAEPTPRGSVVLIAQDGDSQLLDRVLSRQAQPRAGYSPRSPFRGVLQVLPLAFQLAWRPFDPQALLDLLLLPRPPLPKAVARKIATAMAESPGLDGPHWRAVWAEIEATALEDAHTEAEHRSVAAKLERWDAWIRPSPVDFAGGLSLEVVLAICARVADWAVVQCAATGEAYFLGAQRLAQAVVEAVRGLDRESYSRTLLDRIVDQALADGEGDPTSQAQAAPWRTVAHPGSLWGRADTVVWWNFTDTGERPHRTPWTLAERAALRSEGCEPDTDAAAARRLSSAWERPILNAGARLIFVRASLGSGAETAAHPLAHRMAPIMRTEVVTARVEDIFRAPHLGVGGVDLHRREVDPAPVPHAVARWAAPSRFAELAAARVESATAFEDLLACQFAWALKHVARLRPGRARSIPDANQLLGLLAHALAAELLPPGAPPVPATAAAAAEARLDALVDEMAAPLRASAAASDFAFARRRLPASIAALSMALRRNELTVEAMEIGAERQFGGMLAVKGTIDLLARTASGDPVVIDLKWTRSDNARRKEVEDGLAVQLATYVALVDPTLRAEAGYFLLNQREFVVPAGGRLQGRTVTAQRSLGDTWGSVMGTWSAWAAHVADYGLVALGVKGADGLGPANLGLVREVRCDRCDYATLCRVKDTGVSA